MSSLKLLQGSFNKLQLRNVVSRSFLAVRCVSNQADTETHTGQKWDSDDYRLARFVNAPKHVNPNWAIKMIDEVPPKECHERVIACDGGGGPTGHPKVFINLDKPGNHACGYCGLRFFKGDHHH
ncbi:probable NADH dehydrogenase [ubiquinone] iron-sulfur protein 6, mitochondrial [Atheta coriaria]|uniref:probable NADH dehydrogenase [ubiquinone] iron-sulfur protein 6, mitochondrial n=1 Tax=Dalotia coriaria TaxID=877792 RepID=UPI0031F476ED